MSTERALLPSSNPSATGCTCQAWKSTAFRLKAGNPSDTHQTDSISLPQFNPKQDGCPYQIDGLCSVHKARPFACRVFFCQEGSDDWQSEQYESFQAKIKKLHEQHNIPYRYMEWRQGLADAIENGL